jgi:hypothetical protein
MKCPTCENAEEDCCCRCDTEIPEKEQHLRPDPLNQEVNDDYRKHLLCRICCIERERDI